MVPLDFAFFADKPVVWFRIKSVPDDRAQVTEFNKRGLVAFDVFYPWDYLPGIAQYTEPNWNGLGSEWKEFFVEE